MFNDCAKIRSEAIYKSKENKTTGTGLKILTPKQLVQRLPIPLAQVKAGNKSKRLLNEIRKIVYSLYQSKETTKNVYNNTIKSIQRNCIQWKCIQLWKQILYLWTQKIIITKPHVLILKLTDKLDLRRDEKKIALSNLSIYYIWKNIKSS